MGKFLGNHKLPELHILHGINSESVWKCTGGMKTILPEDIPLASVLFIWWWWWRVLSVIPKSPMDGLRLIFILTCEPLCPVDGSFAILEEILSRVEKQTQTHKKATVVHCSNLSPVCMWFYLFFVFWHTSLSSNCLQSHHYKVNHVGTFKVCSKVQILVLSFW